MAESVPAPIAKSDHEAGAVGHDRSDDRHRACGDLDSALHHVQQAEDRYAGRPGQRQVGERGRRQQRRRGRRAEEAGGVRAVGQGADVGAQRRHRRIGGEVVERCPTSAVHRRSSRRALAIVGGGEPDAPAKELIAALSAAGWLSRVCPAPLIAWMTGDPRIVALKLGRRASSLAVSCEGSLSGLAFWLMNGSSDTSCR